MAALRALRKLLGHRRPEAVEQCEVCGKWFPKKKVVVISEQFRESFRYGEDHIRGMTEISATFCKKHAPKENRAT